MSSVNTVDTLTVTATTRTTDNSLLESIWDCDKMKKTVDPVTNKAKKECLHCGMVAACNSTKLTHHAAKKRGGDTRVHVEDHLDHCTKLHNDSFNKIVVAVAARKSCDRQEVSNSIEQQASVIESCSKSMSSTRGKRGLLLAGVDVDWSSSKKPKNLVQSQPIATNPRKGVQQQ